jgi:hypothetical protein
MTPTVPAARPLHLTGSNPHARSAIGGDEPSPKGKLPQAGRCR